MFGSAVFEFLTLRILNVLIPTLMINLTDLVANFVELGYVRTCSGYHFYFS